MFTIDYHARTIPVGIALFEGLYGQIPWGYIMAAAVIATLPVIILIALFQKVYYSRINRRFGKRVRETYSKADTAEYHFQT